MQYDDTYTAAGNILTKTTEHGMYAYEYDLSSRLTGADNPVLDDEAYAYDKVGNRRTSLETLSLWEYNLNNELAGYDDVDYAYDDNGNLIEIRIGGTVAWTYVYDSANRLVHTEDSTGSIVADYYYDPFGRRLWKEVNGTRTYFFYSDEGLIAEYDENGDEIRSYGYQPDSTWTTDPLWLKEGGEYYWYQNDHLGTPQKLVDSTGIVVWSAQYAAFGKATIEVEDVTNHLRFPGQYYDEETGWHYNWFRYYDPRAGRYVSADPIGFLRRDVNFYGYAENSPGTAIDPGGLQPVPQTPIEPLINPPGFTPEIPITEPTWEPLPYQPPPGSPGVIPSWLPRLPGGAVGGGILGAILATLGHFMNPPNAEAPEIDVPPQIDPRLDSDDDENCCTDSRGETCEQCGTITYYVLLPKDSGHRALHWGHGFLEHPRYPAHTEGPIRRSGWSPMGHDVETALDGVPVIGVRTDELDRTSKFYVKRYSACPESLDELEKTMMKNNAGPYHLLNIQARNCYGWAADMFQKAGFHPPISPTMSFAPYIEGDNFQKIDSQALRAFWRNVTECE